MALRVRSAPGLTMPRHPALSMLPEPPSFVCTPAHVRPGPRSGYRLRAPAPKGCGRPHAVHTRMQVPGAVMVTPRRRFRAACQGSSSGCQPPSAEKGTVRLTQPLRLLSPGLPLGFPVWMMHLALAVSHHRPNPRRQGSYALLAVPAASPLQAGQETSSEVDRDRTGRRRREVSPCGLAMQIRPYDLRAGSRLPSDGLLHTRNFLPPELREIRRGWMWPR